MEEKSLRGLGDSLITAIDLFNNQQWHEAHDVLEDIWNYLDGDERQIIQGILQVSVSQLHLTRKNTNGGTILLGEGLGRLKTRKDIDLGIDLESFCDLLESILNKLQQKEPLNEEDIPHIKFTGLM